MHWWRHSCEISPIQDSSMEKCWTWSASISLDPLWAVHFIATLIEQIDVENKLDNPCTRHLNKSVDKVSEQNHWKKGSGFLKCVGSLWALPKSLKSPPPSPSNGQTWKKSFPNHPGKPLHPRAYIGKKKVLQTILASLKHLPNIEEEGVYLPKGLGTFTHLVKVRVLALLSIRFAWNFYQIIFDTKYE